MPIYAVRWADFTLSLIEASNRNDLFWKIDDISDPTSVTFQELENSLYINLKCKSKVIIDGEEEQKKDDDDGVPLEKLRTLMEDKDFCDLEIVIGKNIVLCHKVILGQSEYFKRLIQSSLTKMEGRKILLKDVSLEVFSAVREFLYLGKLDWTSERKSDIIFMLELLKYSHMTQLNDLLKAVETKILNYFKEKGWDYAWGNDEKLNLSEIVTGINVSESLNLTKLQEQLVSFLSNKVTKRKDSNENGKEKRDFLKELRLIETKLADYFQEKLDDAEMVGSASTSFLNVFKDLKSKSFIQDLNNEAGKLKENNMIEKIDFCPYHCIVSNLSDIGNPSKRLVTKCCSAIKTLGGFGFHLDKKGMKFGSVPGLVEPMPTCYHSKALQLAATLGQLELVKELVEIGADPLERVYPNGMTLIHLLDETIRNNECNAGKYSSFLDKKLPKLKVSSKKMGSVLEYLLEHTGHSDVATVPFDVKSKTVNQEYVEELMGRAEFGNLSVPFTLDRCQGHCDSTFSEELALLMHPRASEVVKDIDEENYPEDPTELRKEVASGALRDYQEATRAFHPLMDRFSNHKNDNIRPTNFSGGIIGAMRASLVMQVENEL
eukprot:TCONS_00056045-protein